MSALQIQQERERADLEHHKERVECLSAPAPKWSCGTPVDGFTHRTLLNQSTAAIKFYAQSAAQAAQGDEA